MTRPAPWTALALLALAACGGKDQPKPTPTARTNAALPPATPAETAKEQPAPTVAARASPEVPSAGLTVGVNVLDWLGRPVSGAVVSALRESRDGELSTVAEARTDAKGQAMLPATGLSGSTSLSIEAPSNREDLERFTPVGISVREIRIARGFTLRGKTQGDRGEAVKAKVWMRTGMGSTRLWTALGLLSPGYTDRDLHESEQVGVSAEDGTFTIRGLAYESVEVQATPLDAEEPSTLGFAAWTTVSPGGPSVVLRRQRTTDAALHPDSDR